MLIATMMSAHNEVLAGIRSTRVASLEYCRKQKVSFPWWKVDNVLQGSHTDSIVSLNKGRIYL
jgi:hypothetical protein